MAIKTEEDLVPIISVTAERGDWDKGVLALVKTSITRLAKGYGVHVKFIGKGRADS